MDSASIGTILRCIALTASTALKLSDCVVASIEKVVDRLQACLHAVRSRFFSRYFRVSYVSFQSSTASAESRRLPVILSSHLINETVVLKGSLMLASGLENHAALVAEKFASHHMSAAPCLELCILLLARRPFLMISLSQRHNQIIIASFMRALSPGVEHEIFLGKGARAFMPEFALLSMRPTSCVNPFR